MQIAIIGADTKLGEKILQLAEKHKIRTVSVVSSFTSLRGEGKLLIKNYSDVTIEDLLGCHYVIDAVSFPKITNFSSDLLPLWNELEVLKDTDLSLLCVGSSAFLYTDKNKQHFVFDENDVVLSDEQQKADRLSLNAFKRLQKCTNVKWSALCPPLLLEDNTYGTGEYEITDSVLPVGLDGSSKISLNDFVSAIIDVLKQGVSYHKAMSVRQK